MHFESGLLILVFVTSSLLIGSLVRHLFKTSGLPYTVALLLIGIGLGLLERYGWFANMPLFEATLGLVADIEPHLILFLFLPTLIFESAFAMEVHLFRRIFSQIAILAVPGLILATVTTAALAHYLFPWDWSWPVCLMFGALISATDPVAVVALLKEVSSRKRLETLIEGESLLNDGTAIVLFGLFFVGVSAGDTNLSFEFTEVVGEFIWVVAAGLGIGVIAGALALVWIGKVFNDPMIEISLTIALAYLVFLLAEHGLHVSGVVAVVALALLFGGIGRTRISPEVSEFLHHFWEMMAHIANTLIFLLVGVLVAKRLPLNDMELWTSLLILYAGILLIRAMCISVFMPLLKRIGIGINRDKALVLWWGGLRGAVSLALALTVAQAATIPTALGNQILFLSAGIVVLTILVNGSSMGWLLAQLGLNRLPDAKQATVDKAESVIRRELFELQQELAADEMLARTDWDSVKSLLNLDDHAIDTADIEDEDLAVAFRRRLLETERKHYWSQFKRGILGRSATDKLVSAVEQALDGEPCIHPRPALQRWLSPPSLSKRLPINSRLSKLWLNFAFKRLAIGYTAVRGFLLAQEEIALRVSELAPSPEEAEKVHGEILQNKKDTLVLLEQFRETFPELIGSLESYSAIRLLLYRERLVIQELMEEGVLDSPEAQRLIDDVEHRMSSQKRVSTPTADTTPADIIRQSSWAAGASANTVDQLQKLASQQIYGPGECILSSGKCAAVGIISRGTAEVTGNEGQVIDVLGTGGMVGAKALLTGSNPHSITANSFVEVLWLPLERIRALMADDNRLAENLSQMVNDSSD